MSAVINNNQPDFWLGKKVKVVIDRPLGSRHPDYPGSIYPINYGHIQDTFSPADQEEIDAYVLGPTNPIKEFSGQVVAVICRTDKEIKLVVTDGNPYSRKKIARITHFQEKYHQSEILIRNEKIPPSFYPLA